MAAESRWSMLQEVDATCPRCRMPLPTIPLCTIVVASGHRTLRLEVLPQLDEEWWQLARRGHPQCLTDPAARRTQDGSEVLEG